MATPTAQEVDPPRSLWQRLKGARETEPEAELFGPRGKLPPRGEPDTDRDAALRILVGLIIAAVVLRLAVPRGPQSPEVRPTSFPSASPLLRTCC